ncbi:MAG: DedA family protein [Tepidisphaeraceae bacterium]
MSRWFFFVFLTLAVFDPETVERWMNTGGYIVLFGLLFACGLGLPLPEDIPLLGAGYLVQQGKMNLVIAPVLAWLGIIGGDCVLYYMGRKFGLEITRVPFVGKHLTKERILKAEHLFERWGIWVVGIGRMFAGIRGAMVVAAGAIRFNFVKFVIADGIAAIVSGGLFVALGYWLGKKFGSIREIKERMKGVEHWVYLGVGVAVVLIVLYAWWRHRRHKTLSEVALEKVEEKIEAHDAKRPHAHPVNLPAK